MISRIPVAGTEVMVRTRPAAERPLLLFPSIGEYMAYDEGAYDGFRDSGLRNVAYRAAIKAAGAGKPVVDIGTGPDALWAIAAARAGARHVYAIEASAQQAAQAQSAVRRAGVSDIVRVITAWSADIGLPERAEVCISEVIGNIASAEGVIAVIADARSRLCTPQCVMIPSRCQTLIAAISMAWPGQAAEYALAEESLPYLRHVFEQRGRPFDLRLCLSGQLDQAVLTPPGVIEDLTFGEQDQRSLQIITRLTVERPGLLHGFALWVRLWTMPEHPLVEALPEQERSWAPVYAPISASGICVRTGDHISLTLSRVVRDAAGRPDYRLEADVFRAGRSPMRSSWKSPLHDHRFRGTSMYRQLFPSVCPCPLRDPAIPSIDPAAAPQDSAPIEGR